MLLRFRLRCIACSVLFPCALVTVQMVTPMVGEQDQASHSTADTACSTIGMDNVKALSLVLATVATKLDKLEKEEKELTEKGRRRGVPVKIDRKEPLKEVGRCHS